MHISKQKHEFVRLAHRFATCQGESPPEPAADHRSPAGTFPRLGLFSLRIFAGSDFHPDPVTFLKVSPMLPPPVVDGVDHGFCPEKV